MKQTPRWLWVIAALPLLLLVVPIIALMMHAADNGELWSSLQSESVRTTLLVSLLSSLCALLITIVLGTPLAWLLARKNFRGKRIINALVDLPLVLPPAVAGLALLMAFGRNGVLGGIFPDGLAFTSAAVVIAQAFVAAPFYIRSATSGFQSIPPEIEGVAATLGASPQKIFRRITLPLAWPSLVGGAVLCWTRALGEFGATIMFAGDMPGQTRTMPIAIYKAMESNLAEALALSVLLVLSSLLVLLLIQRVKHAR